MWYGAFMNTYELIRSRRKTLALEITKDGQVLVRAPQLLPHSRIDQFVQAHAAWIDTHLEQVREALRTAPPPPTPEEVSQLKAEARRILPEKVRFWEQQIGVRAAGIKITSAEHRYGSCSGKNRLCFSYRLMQCPEEAVELVVVHELCHILEHNHSPRFYALLEQYLPDWRERKKLLR